MLDHILCCAVIITYNNINDKTSVTELIFYQPQNFICLHTFITPLEVLWDLIFLYLLYPIIHSIILLAGIFIYNHTNNILGYPAGDE